MKSVKRSIKRHGLFGSFNELIGRFFLAIAIIFLVVMCLGIFAEIFSRNISVSLGWTKMLAIELMPYVAFLVAPFAYRRHLFAKIEIFTDRLEGRVQYGLMLFIHVLECIILGLFSYYAYKLFTTALPQTLGGLTQLYRFILTPFVAPENLHQYRFVSPWSYSIIFISFAFMFLVNIEHIGRALSSLIKNKDCTTRRLFKIERIEQEQDDDDFLTLHAPHNKAYKES